MLKFILAALLLIPSLACSDDWSAADTKREAIYLTLHAADWLQTRQIAKNPDKFRELNPILGTHPHVDKVDTLFLLSGLSHAFASKILPAEYRKVFQYITIGVRAGVVANNYNVGVKVKF